jgi:hypothetical protein
MKHDANRTRGSQLFGLVLVLLGPLPLGCQAKPSGRAATPPDPTVVLFPERAPNPLVENGRAYDKAVIDTRDLKTVVLPEGPKIEIEHGGPRGRIEIFMEKVQGFGGHLGKPMSIRETRKKMGCAKKAEADKTVIGTFGEWDSNIEGGAYMHLLFRVPAGVKVETRNGLCGPYGARKGRGGPLIREERIVPGEGGWQAIPDEPDPALTAKSAGGS